MLKFNCRWRFQDTETCKFPTTATAYSALSTYNKGDVVDLSGVLYVALTGPLINAQPDLFPSSWEVLNCDKTFGYCELINNTPRFGGFPGIGRKGLRF